MNAGFLNQQDDRTKEYETINDPCGLAIPLGGRFFVWMLADWLVYPNFGLSFRLFHDSSSSSIFNQQFNVLYSGA